MDTASARTIFADAFPDLPIRTLRAIDEGWNFLVIEINGELIARFPREDWVAAKLEQDEVLLPLMNDAVGLPVPKVQALVRAPDGRPIFQLYAKLPGELLTPTLERGLSVSVLSVQLGRFLTRLHGLDTDSLASKGLVDPGPEAWLASWTSLSERIEDEILPMLEPAGRESAHAFMADNLGPEISTFHPALLHGDLGWNILVDVKISSVTGIIDWGDARIGDPAYDLAAFKGEYSDAFYEGVLRAYERDVDDAFEWRVGWYARMLPLYTTLFARQSGRDRLAESYLELAKKVFPG